MSAEAAEPFFRHASPGAAMAGEPLQNDTRYLAAAMYLDRSLADRVIHEYVDDDNRAVVPSFGFDLRPVILHALRARRLRLYRDLILAAVWIVAWILVPAGAFVYGFLALYAALLYAIPWRRMRWRWRLVAIWFILNLGIPLAWLGINGFRDLRDSSSSLSGYDQPIEEPGLLDSFETEHPFLLMLAFTAAFAFVIIGHLALVFRILARDLGPEATGPGPASYGERVGGLLDRVDSAQRGNVTLYSGENPFIGAGDVKAPWARAWSVVLELDRPASGVLGTLQKAMPVDPVVMHQRVRTRLQEMRDEWPPREPGAPEPDRSLWLPPNERIAGLVTDVHIVGRGECAQRRRPLDPISGRYFDGHPLIDAQAGVPFSVASPEAVEAIIRHPQGGVRCYQRVTVGARGQAIMGPGDRAVAPAEDQDIALSAFVYLAVEGRMLYAQFVATVLPPIRREFRLIDFLPNWSVPTLLAKSLRAGWRSVLSGLLLAVPRILSSCWAMSRGVRAGLTSRHPSRYMAYDYGARISVRELAAEEEFHTFLQELDADKYTRLIERRVNEALLDHLEGECGIDVSAYRTQAGVILNEGVIMTGGSVSGQIAVGGEGARIEQRQTRQPPRTGTSGINP
ncbi:hypothetical protein [Actinomadura sp. 9N407]|uniref:hypothetical protein n=1 Tax=Actinomadura sp. 9N407 TaxID=3375154 RepID=UPI003798A13C